MKNKLVIFDCDGTIMDSLGFAMDSFLYALDLIDRRPSSPEQIKRYFGSSADKIFLNYLGDASLADLAFQHFLAHQRDLALQTKLHPGMLKVLQHLRERNYPMAIVTGRHALDLDILLKPHGIADYFEVCVADSDISKPKPSPEGINLVLKKLSVHSQDACYIGDSAVDMRAAHSAGVTAIAALWDKHANYQELSIERPHYLAETPLDLLQLLK